MANINQHTREVSAKIVYYGPAGSGKTASIEFINGKLRTDLRGRLSHIPTQIDPTVTYEMLPVELGEIKGMRTKFEVTSVPGDPIQRSTRKILLRDVDGIVFVADARPGRLESNIESLKDLEENLAAYGRSLADVPMVFQWNRSDDPEALEPDELDRRLNESGSRTFRTAATSGAGVLEGLTTIAKLILRRLRSKPSGGKTAAGAPAEKAAAPAPASSDPGGEPARIRVRVAEPPPLDEGDLDGRGGESFDPRPLAAEAHVADDLEEDEGVPDQLPEALMAEIGEEMPDLEIPMEPLQDDADMDDSVEILEAGFQPIDFTAEVTDLAERGDTDIGLEIVSVGAPTRLGPTSISIPIEIREEGNPVRAAQIRVTLTGPSNKG